MNLEDLKGRYHEQSVWLICGGPSVRGFDFSLLHGTVAAINEIGRDCEPDLWIGNDNLTKTEIYPPGFWETDSLKFIRKSQLDRPENIKNLVSVRDCYHSSGLEPREFLDGRCVCWGTLCDEGRRTKKSVMLLAIGILYRLGFREVRLLGCDWGRDAGSHYGHQYKNHLYEDKTEEQAAIEEARLHFRLLEWWFKTLQPYFLARDYRILNCTDGGNLEVFERRDWREFAQKESPPPLSR